MENQTQPFGIVCIMYSLSLSYRICLDGKPPYDGFPVTAFDKNNIVLVFMYDMVATCGLVFVIVCFSFNVAFRNRK